MRLGGTFAFFVALLLFGVTPAQAQPAPPPLDAYGELPGVEDMAISPSGQWIAVAALVGGARRLVVLDRAGKIRTAIPLEAAKLRSISWAGEDLVLIQTSNTQNLGFGFIQNKYEFVASIVIPLNGGKPYRVFERTPSLVKATFGSHGVRQVGDKWTGVFEGLELRAASSGGFEFDHGRPALFKVDLEDNDPSKIARAPVEGHYRDWLIDGSGVPTVTLDVSRESGKWEISGIKGKTIASGIDPTGDVGLVAFGRTGDSAIYSVEDDEAGETRWYEAPLTGGDPVEIFADIELKRIYVDPANGRLLGYLPDNGARVPVLFDPAQEKALRLVYRAFPKLDIEIMQWTPSFSHVLVRASGNGDSGTWYVVDLAARRADPVGIERPTIASGQVGTISTVPYKATDGLELDGILTLPPGREAKNLPVIIMPHGGPHSHDVAAFDWWAQAFASRGYAVFQPNFRGSTNRDRAFVRAGYGQWGRKMQSDLSDGLAELARQGVIDPKRACIVGASYGGYAALAGVTLQTGLYRCAVAVAPVSDIQEMYATNYRESGDSRMTRRNQRESLGDPKSFAEVSPRRHAANANAPILLIHGKDDTVVAFKQSDAMADALRKAGKPYQLVILREEDHWLSRSATRKQMLNETMRFVEAHNPAR